MPNASSPGLLYLDSSALLKLVVTDEPGLGVCLPGTVRALLALAPDLRLKDNLATQAARFLPRSEACREAYALVQRRQQS